MLAALPIERAPRVVWTYWEGPLPPFLHLCLQTWGDLDVRVLTPGRLVRAIGFARPSAWERLAVGQRADLVQAHVLAEYGGLWLDVDTIVLGAASINEVFEQLDAGCEVVGWHAPHTPASSCEQPLRI